MMENMATQNKQIKNINTMVCKQMFLIKDSGRTMTESEFCSNRRLKKLLLYLQQAHSALTIDNQE